MKSLYGLIALLSVALLSCELNTVTVKAKPNVAVPAGTLSVEVGKKLGDAIKDATKEGMPFTVEEGPGGFMQLSYSQNLIDLPLSDFFSGGDIGLADVNKSFDNSANPLTIPDLASSTATIPVVLAAPPGSQNLTLPAIAGSMTIPLGDVFDSAEIGAGSLNINLPDPVGLTITSTSLSISLVQKDAAGTEYTVYQDSSNQNDPSFDLAGVGILGSDITLNYSLSLTVDSPAGAAPENLNLTAGFSVSSFNSITFKVPELNLSQNINVAFDDQQKHFIDYVKLDPSSGVVFSFANGLPTDMTLDITSSALGISDSVTVPSGGSVTDYPFAVTNFDINVDGLDNLGNVVDANPGFDFTVAVSLGGYDTTDGTLTLGSVANPVTPGTTYTYAGNLAASILPTEIGLKDLMSSPLTGSFPQDGSKLPLDALGKFLPPEIGFKEIPLSLTISGLQNLSGELALTGKYTKDTVPASMALLSGTKPDGVTPKGAFSTDGDGNAVESITADLAAFLNTRSDDGVILEYSFQASTATITLDPNVKRNLVVDLDLKIPFALVVDLSSSPNAVTVKDSAGNIIKKADGITDQKWIALKLADPDPLVFTGKGDLFGRKEGETSNLNDVIKGLRTGSFNFLTKTNTSGLRFAIQLEMPHPDSTVASPLPPLTSSLNMITGAKSSLNLSTDEIRAFQKIPFEPIIRVLVPEGEFGISYSGMLELTVDLQAQTDINLDVPLK